MFAVESPGRRAGREATANPSFSVAHFNVERCQSESLPLLAGEKSGRSHPANVTLRPLCSAWRGFRPRSPWSVKVVLVSHTPADTFLYQFVVLQDGRGYNGSPGMPGHPGSPGVKGDQVSERGSCSLG